MMTMVKVKCIYIAPSRQAYKGPFIATQLNSTPLNSMLS